MKKLVFPILLVLGLSALALFVPIPALASFVELPVEQKAGITAILITVVGLLFDIAIGKFPWLQFFNQYREAWSLALAGLLINWLQNALPTGSDPVAIPGVAFLIAVVLYLLSRKILKERKVAALQ